MLIQQLTRFKKWIFFVVIITDSLFFVAVLNEQMKETGGSFSEYEKEIEELKELLPEIREKIEDAKESQRSGNVAELALKATLVRSVSS
jgi:nuclear autoantigenic sperm protein